MEVYDSEGVANVKALIELASIQHRFRIFYLIQFTNLMSTFRLKHSYPIITLIYIGFIAYQPKYLNLMISKDQMTPVLQSFRVYFISTTHIVVSILLLSYLMQGALVITYIYHHLSD